ncbi:MAG TPA: phage holin family protein [Bacteroidales bacterium]|nr:phage holin family protein [Bacteroidales bacterium]
MAEKNANTNNGFQQVFVELKEYVRLQTDYLQVSLIEKLTKLFAKVIFALVAFFLMLGTFFYLMFALANALEPTLGFVASYSIVAAIFLVLFVIALLFRKRLFVTPILKMMVEIFYDETKEEGKQDNENDATTL